MKNFLKINIVLLTILIINFVLLGLFLNPIQSHAAIPIDGEVSYTEEEVGLNIPNPLGETSDVSTLASNIIKFLIILAIPITGILVVYAGYLYITSAGNEEKVKTAQKALIWAIVGFAVVLIASSVPAIIQEFLTGESEESGQLTEPEQSDDSGPGLPSVSPSPHDSDDVFIID